MGKISGKFAPLTEELGNDARFIIESKDLDKLLYILIIYTCHMTNHQAPKDARFYKIRYGLCAKRGQIAASLRRLADMYPKLSWGDKNLSLLNSATYKSQIVPRIRIEEEKEEELERERDARTPPPKQDKVLNATKTETKSPYGETGLVMLTVAEHEKLTARLGEKRTHEYIQRLENYIGSTGKRYKSHYHTIMNWLGNDGLTEKRNGRDTKQQPEERREKLMKAIEEIHFES